MHVRADIASVRPCRGWAADVAARHGASDKTQKIVALLTSELVTNAVKYAPDGDVEVDARHADGVLRIAVSDGGEELPVVLDPPPTATGGRGMRLVRSLAHAWGVDRRDGGKTVWFEVLVPDPAH